MSWNMAAFPAFDRDLATLDNSASLKLSAIITIGEVSIVFYEETDEHAHVDFGPALTRFTGNVCPLSMARLIACLTSKQPSTLILYRDVALMGCIRFLVCLQV